MTGTDVEESILVFQIEDLPANGELSGAAPNIVYLPNQGFSGTDSFSFLVNDGDLDSAEVTIFIEVVNVNEAPQILTSGPRNAFQGELYQYPVYATDPNPGDSITYSLDYSPAGMTLNSSTGDLAWMPQDYLVNPILNFNPNCVAPSESLDSLHSGKDFSMTLEWAWTGSSLVPQSDQVRIDPVVGNLTDDNGDGVINEADIPDIVFVTQRPIASGISNDCLSGTLRAISGDGSGEIFTVRTDSDPSLLIHSCVTPAIVDLDFDGSPEIVTFKTVDPASPQNEDAILIFNSDGSLKHRGENIFETRRDDLGFLVFGHMGAIDVADLENDGQIEIIYGNSVFDDQGRVKFHTPGWGPINHVAPVVADVDLDGIKEVIYGNNIYDASGNLFLAIPKYPRIPINQFAEQYPEGTPAIVNLDSDPYPEIVITNTGKLTAVNHDGSQIVDSFNPGRFNQPSVGPPLIADVDADGQSEIIIGSSSSLAVYEKDFSVRWFRSMDTGGFQEMNSLAVADLNGDGKMELIGKPGGGPDSKITIFEASTGRILGETLLRTNSVHGSPVPVDVDRDGKIEIVTRSNSDTSNGGSTTGIFIYSNESWTNGPASWPKYNYISGQFNDQLQLQSENFLPWLSHNSIRTAQPDENEPTSLIDLALVDLIVQPSTEGLATARVKAINLGTRDLNVRATLKLHRGSPAFPGELIEEKEIFGLPEGESVELIFEEFAISDLDESIYVTIEPDPNIPECITTNNFSISSIVGLQASDSSGLTDSQLYSVQVFPTDFNPSIVSTPPSIVTYKQDYVYRVEATDPTVGDYITYSLEQGPQGMTIDSVSGILRWSPLFGTENFTAIVRATDLSGNFDEQALSVNVIDSCSSPTVQNTQLPQGAAGLPYSHQLNYYYPGDSSEISFFIESEPEGMEIDNASGLISWNNPLEGDFKVNVIVQDSSGLRDIKPVLITIRASDGVPPSISASNKSIQAGRTLYSSIRPTQDSFDPGWQIALISAPVGFEIDQLGRFTWTPQISGIYQVSLDVTDPEGLTTSKTFQINVSEPEEGAVQAPTIINVPPATVSLGSEFIFEPEIVPDPAASVPRTTFELLNEPDRMTKSSDTVRWRPENSDLGVHTYQILTRHPFVPSKWALYRYSLEVVPRQCGTPEYPQVIGNPISTATIGEPFGSNLNEGIPGQEDWGYSFSVDTGPNAVSPYFTLIDGPLGAEIDSTQGILRWNPVTAPAGFQEFVIQIALGYQGPSIDYRFKVLVAEPLGSGAPEILSEPPYFVTVEELFQYQVEATDPSAGILRYFLSRYPQGMEIDSETGLITWTPSSEQFGGASVEVIVESSNGKIANQIFSLTVRAPGLNSPPYFDSVPALLAKVGVEYFYDSNAVEDDADDMVTYSLEGAPLGMALDDQGRGDISWTPTEVGQFTVVLKATDQGGGVDQQTINIEVVPSAELQLVIPQAQVAPGETLTAGLSIAQGAVEGGTLELLFDGQPLTPVPGFVSFPAPEELGDYQLLAIYSDQIETVTKSLTVTVTDEAPGLPPQVEINSPADTSEVTAPEDIFISVSDPELVDWTLSLTELGSFARNQQPIVLATGNTELITAQVAEFDPTLLSNGLYQLRLEAVNASGQLGVTTQTVRVEGEMKVGNFTISFIDLSIPLSGIPITVTRTYDSRLRNQELDFGFGWSVSYQAMKIAENKVPGDKWRLSTSGGTFPSYCVEAGEETYVAVTLPDGDVEEFDIKFQPECQPLVPIEFVTPIFVPRPGTSSTLEWTESYPLSVSNGEIYDPVRVQTFNPDSYLLTTKEGTKFEVLEGVGIKEMSDTNDNTLTFTDDGIFHSDGKSILFTRDDSGRITEVLAPDGTKIVYAYDAAGDLVSVTDQVSNTTNFVYGTAGSTSAAHYLTEIIDPRGETPAKMVYDDDGRLIKSVDALGNEILYGHDIAGRQEVVTDRRGYNTVFVYDDEGNVLTKTDALGGVTAYTYDSEGNELTVTDENGNTTTNTYDANNNVLSETDPLGRTTNYSYDSDNNLTSITDDAGNITALGYDTNRNLLTLTDAENNITTNSYDGKGRLAQVTDAEGGVTSYSYDSSGNRIQMVDNTGVVTDFSYDQNGNQLTRSTSRTTDSGVVTMTTTMVYDDLNRVVQQTNAEGEVTSTVYNSIGKVESTTDGRGKTTSMSYDERGNLAATSYADGTSTSVSYDAEGNKVTETDRLGRVSTMAYDELGRMISTTYPDNTVISTSYDPAGRVTGTTDARGNSSSNTYDDAGQVLSTTNALGDISSFSYDNRGNRISATNERGHATTFVYDSINRNISTSFPNGTSVSRSYDGLSRILSQTDQAGKVTSFGYDASSRLTSVTDALGNVTSYSYDEQGNKLTQSDAEGRVTSWTYDNMGRVLTRELPLGQLESMSYDDGGNLVSRTDFNGNTTIHTYDDVNRLLSRSFQDGSSYTWTYTDTGRVATETNYLGTTSYAYDNRDRLSRQDNPDVSFLAYTYDENGNRLSVETASGTTSYTFDELNRMETVIDSGGLITAYTYDKVGNQVAVGHANGTVTTSVFDSLNRLTSVKTADMLGTVLTQFDYSLDLVGNRTEVVELGRTVSYGYDDLYRLTSENITDPVNGNNLFEYSYDKVGNRLTKTVNSGAPVSYVYDDNDRISSGEGVTYSYDDNGNLISKSGVSSSLQYSYDHDDRVREVQDFFAGPLFNVTYGYDVGGVRQRKSVDGVSINFVVDENRPYAQVVEELDDANNLVSAFTYGTDLLSQDTGTSQSFYHYDGLGSTRGLSGLAGVLTDQYDYEAFGSVLNKTGSTVNSYLFAGEQFDAETGNYYLRARYMEPRDGRFTQMDLFQGIEMSPETLNAYLFVKSNPVNYIDPSGYFFNSQGFYNTLIGQAAVSAGQRTAVGVSRKVLFKVVAQLSITTGVILYPNTDVEREEDYVMRLQLQKGSSVYWGRERGVMEVKIEPGVTTGLVRTYLFNMWRDISNGDPGPGALGFPRNNNEKMERLWGAMVQMSIEVGRFPPAGTLRPNGAALGGNIARTWLVRHGTGPDPDRDFRIDLENLRGVNLTQ